jgi:hypothetical protein
LGGALEAAGEAEEVVVAVRRRGGSRETTILGDGGDGFIDVVIVEIAAEVEGRGRRHLATETPKRQEARGRNRIEDAQWGWVLFLVGSHLSHLPRRGRRGREAAASVCDPCSLGARHEGRQRGSRMVVGMEAVARMAGMGEAARMAGKEAGAAARMAGKEAAARMAGMEAAAGAGSDPALGATRDRGWHRNRTVGMDAIGRSG